MYFPSDDEEDNGLRPKMKSKGAKTFTLKLTSLIDMFTLILVFLLKSFSAEGEIMTLTDDLLLPESTSKKKPEVASVVAINQEYILLDGEQVVSTSRVFSLPADAKIPELRNALQTHKSLAEGLGQVDEKMDFSGKISIQADKQIPYIIVKKVMMTCGSVGYNDMMLAVMEIE